MNVRGETGSAGSVVAVETGGETRSSYREYSRKDRPAHPCLQDSVCASSSGGVLNDVADSRTARAIAVKLGVNQFRELEILGKPSRKTVCIRNLVRNKPSACTISSSNDLRILCPTKRTYRTGATAVGFIACIAHTGGQPCVGFHVAGCLGARDTKAEQGISHAIFCVDHSRVSAEFPDWTLHAEKLAVDNKLVRIYNTCTGFICEFFAPSFAEQPRFAYKSTAGAKLQIRLSSRARCCICGQSRRI